MSIEELLNKTRKKYSFWFTDDNSDNVYYLLDDPTLFLTDGMDPFQVEWDEEVNHIAVAAYLPGKLIGDFPVQLGNEQEYRIFARVLYLKLAVEDEEIERLKAKSAEELKMELFRRKILHTEEVCYFPEKFEELFFKRVEDEKES